MFLIVGGEGSSNRNASRDESVEAGDKSVEAGDESIEAGEKTPQSCYNVGQHIGCVVTVVCGFQQRGVTISGKRHPVLPKKPCIGFFYLSGYFDHFFISLFCLMNGCHSI